jgi:hypothetical protein
MKKTGIVLAAAAVLIGVSICLIGVAHSDTNTNVASDSLKRLCESIVSQAGRGEKKGFDLFRENMAFRPTTALDKELYDSAARRQMAEMLDFQEKCGSFLGCELAEEKNLTSTLRRYVYLTKYERSVMRWTFVFYRPHEEWKILSLRFKDLASDPLP